MYQEIINSSLQTLIMTMGAWGLTVLIGLPMAVLIAQVEHQ